VQVRSTASRFFEFVKPADAGPLVLLNQKKGERCRSASI